MVPGRPVLSERFLRRVFDPAPASARGPRSRVAPQPKIPHAGRGWSPALCRRHPSRTLSLERDLGVSERARERDIRLAHGDPDAVDEWELERARSDPLPDFLEKAGVTVCHDLGDEVVHAAIV